LINDIYYHSFQKNKNNGFISTFHNQESYNFTTLFVQEIEFSVFQIA